jgi:hypothetical protein
MDDCPHTSDEVCREISGELREMAIWLAGGRLKPEQFRAALMTLEAEKVKRFGFRLSGENSGPGRTHFELRFAESGKLCASLDFHSGSKKLEIHQECG